MGAGAMRERITFQEEAKVSDNAGSFTKSWQNIAETPTVWAEVTPVRGTEKVEAGHLKAVQTYLVKIHYRTDIKASYRIQWGSVLMNIRSKANRDQKKKYLTIEAEHGPTQ